ncbi:MULTISPECIES: single-stranded DNA-binding protein [unclassified Granulicatella]|uniref:single-stranded DNA-binding protein n=1 Tax=unclassified Granulicatella TaxID=2630493 RepID=UPI0010746C52|nr:MULTISPECIES: single-stranded DNA-binding protein [unclassified Granulicatella]MBF0780824.1 single-stranded DNA-binding protein [Granulicatella sp. 19428wC4_WM01]TFU93531.1 single-stranded DNA-binding protein [Granulicatella sp. WM01]
MNDVSVIGRFVKPIVVKDLGEEKYVINNVLAIPRKKKVEGQQQADFVPIVVWGNLAKLVEKYCQKGNLIGVSGRLNSRQYVTKEGKSMVVVEIIVNDIHLMEGKRYIE